MIDKKNALDLFRNNGFGLFPQGFFPNFIEDNIWDSLGLGGFKADVREKKDAYIIEAEMPGFNKENVHIDINDHLLTVSAQMEEQSDQKDEEGQFICRERRSGSFHRSFSLENVKADEIKAEMKNGILTITCPKKSQTILNSKQIEIE